MLKRDGSVCIHSDDRAYKPLNWMTPPCTLTEQEDEDGNALWVVKNPKGERLEITIYEVVSETTTDLGEEPGLIKDGVERHLQELLAEQPFWLGKDVQLVKREYQTPIGPVDLLCYGPNGHLIVEVKRHADLDGVRQLERYVKLLERDPELRPVQGVLAAQTVKPQARVYAEDQGFRCVVLNYDEMRGIPSEQPTLF